MHIFYTPNISGDNHTLSTEESKHAVRVLRVRESDKVLLVDGKGRQYEAEVSVPDPKRCGLRVLEVKEGVKRNYYLHMAVAPTKNIDRFEWYLEKATEIGIDEITPIITKHSERKVIKPERLEKVIVAAMKQSIKALKPKLNPLCTFNEFLQNNTENLAIAHCYERDKTPLKELSQEKSNLTVMIGPEGDFSEAEVESAITAGAIPVSLGESRLRTETAAVVACHTVSLMNE